MQCSVHHWSWIDRSRGAQKRSRKSFLFTFDFKFVFHNFYLISLELKTFNMVYIHIPEALTEEEQMLMAKYAKLKKKVREKIFVWIFWCENIFL